MKNVVEILMKIEGLIWNAHFSMLLLGCLMKLGNFWNKGFQKNFSLFDALCLYVNNKCFYGFYLLAFPLPNMEMEINT